MSTVEQLLAAEFNPLDRPFFARVHRRLQETWQRQGPRNSFLDEYIERAVSGAETSPQDDARAFTEVISGTASQDQIGALLVALQPESLPASTIAAFAKIMRERSLPIGIDLAPDEILGDTCGTGSDTLGTFNVSTTIMFVLAAAGIKIAKHGNRAVTSKCGSADVLDELRVRIVLDPPQVVDCINEVGIGFMFAPEFHKALRNVQEIRRLLAEEMPISLSRRTVFNVLGPLANPAKANTQIIGVYSKGLVRKFADVLKELGVKRAIVAHGLIPDSTPDSMVGLDEFSTVGTTVVAELRDGKIFESEITPEDVGLHRPRDPGILKGGDKKTNAKILRSILANEDDQARIDLALFNAGAGLYVGDKASSIREGVRRAREIIESGEATKKLDAFIAFTSAQV